MTTKAWKHSHIVAAAGGMLIGAFAIWECWDYPMGSVTRMGPGYFPFLLGILLFVVSLGIVLFEGRILDGPDISRPAFPGLVWVPLAVTAFALLVERAGLVPAILAAVFLTAQADKDLGWKETGVLALCTAAVCTVVFIYVLGLPLEPVRF